MRTDKYQIREHPQNRRLGNMLDDLDDVHNHFLALEKRYYRRYGLYAGRFRLQPHLTKLLQRTHNHWAWIPERIGCPLLQITPAKKFCPLQVKV